MLTNNTVGGVGPLNFDYKLLDFGNGRKLEQFGSYILDRPSPASTTKPSNPEIWHTKTATFIPEVGWDIPENLYKEWTISILDAVVRLKLSVSGQVGIFPEQYQNWIFLRDLSDHCTKELNILNGFAYTGISTIFSVNGLNRITHVDGSSSAINWAKENYKMNFNSSGVRFINDDMITFMNKEVKRGKKYSGFIFDPPEFGRGPNGEWSLKKDLEKLIELTNQLAYEPYFFIFSTHSQWLGKKELLSFMKKLKFFNKNYEIFDLDLVSEYNKKLNMGICFRWISH